MTILAVVLEEVARRSGNPLCGNCGAFFFRSAPAPAVRPLGARSRRLLCVCLSCFGVALARRALPSARGPRLKRVPSSRGNIGAPPPFAPFCNAACGGAAPLFILTRYKKMAALSERASKPSENVCLQKGCKRSPRWNPRAPF